jgi:hypothetical protein
VRRLRPRHVAVAQGAFYLATGLWPIVGMRSFERASGPKVEKWLVKTMGALIAAVGGALLLQPARVARPLGVLAATALGACDVVFAGKGRIKKTYLLDAAVEAALVSAWAIALPSRLGRKETPARADNGPIA